MIDYALQSNLAVGTLLDAMSARSIAVVQTVRVEDLLGLSFLIVLASLVCVEMKHPFLRPGLSTLKHSYATNIGTFLLNDISLSLMSIPSLYFVARQFSDAGVLSPLPEGPVKYLITFLLLDLTLYVWHWATHHWDALWVFHKVHHSDRTFNVTTGLRFHVGELLLEVMVRVGFIVVTGVSPEAVLVYQTAMSLFILFHHSNITFPVEAMLARFLIVPRLHRMHHSAVRSEHDSNYGAVLSVWDRLFGTLREGEPRTIGLHGVDEQRIADLVRYGFSWKVEFASIPAAGKGNLAVEDGAQRCAEFD